MKNKKKGNRKKTKAIAAVLIVALVMKAYIGHSDSYIRDRVVKLVSSRGSCSGEQVRAPSGADYILTAGHCSALEVDGSIEAITEDGKHVMRRVVAEDKASDLLLLEGVPNLRGLSIAGSSHPKQDVRTFTHGLGMDTYKTEGVLIQDQEVVIPTSMIASSEDAAKCSDKKYSIVPIFGPLAFCALKIIETATTAMIAHGSSGGPAVDNSGDLVGVASATGGGFGFLVRLSDIKTFINNY